MGSKTWKMLLGEQLPYINVQMKNIDGYQYITLEGHLVYENIEFVKKEIEQILCYPNGYILDKSKLKFIDIAGVGYLLGLAKQVKQHSEGLAIVLNNNQPLLDLLMLPKLHHYIHIVEDHIQAIHMLKKEQPLQAIEHYEIVHSWGERK